MLEFTIACLIVIFACAVWLSWPVRPTSCWRLAITDDDGQLQRLKICCRGREVIVYPNDYGRDCDGVLTLYGSGCICNQCKNAALTTLKENETEGVLK